MQPTHQKKGFCSSNPEIDENDENGGCHPGKVTVYQKRRFDNPGFLWILKWPFVQKARFHAEFLEQVLLSRGFGGQKNPSELLKVILRKLLW